MTTLHILILDDDPIGVRVALTKALDPFLQSGVKIPMLNRQQTAPVTLQVGKDSVKCVFVSSTVGDASTVIGQLRDGRFKGEYDLVLLDAAWAEDENAGANKILPVIIKSETGITGPLCTLRPFIALFTMYWESVGETYINRLLEMQRDNDLDFSTFDGLQKDDVGRLRLLFLNAVRTRQLAGNQAALWAAQRVSHGSSPLFQYTRHLVGIDQAIYELSDRLEAFFIWQEGRWESLSENDRPKFVSCFLLQGEPGCAKTDICKAVVAAFKGNDDGQSFLPKDLGPTDRAKGWKKLLQDSLVPLYKKAALEAKVIVIVADDLAWPSLATMQTGEMAAEWQHYMQSVRDCIKDADRINRKQEPMVPWINNIAKTWNGKIFWLLAKNTVREIGQAYAPIVDFMSAVPLQFPREDFSREQILNVYAERHQMKFEPGASKLAVNSLCPPAYLGREFVGDEGSGKGFAYWCVERVKKISREAKEKGVTIPRIITTRIVQEWLATEQHRAIVGLEAHSSPSNGPISSSASQNESLSRETPGSDHAKLASHCRAIFQTNGLSIKNDPDSIYHSEGPPFLKLVLAAFYTEVETGRMEKKQFNQIFGFLAGKREKTQIRQYLQQLTQRAPDVFVPYPGTKQYGMRDLIADGNRLSTEGFTIAALIQLKS